MTGQLHRVTGLLRQAAGGSDSAMDELIPLVYAELRKIAAAYLRRERENHTLQPTALVNEAWLKLVHQPGIEWQDRAHFFGMAAKMMRQILVDHARARRAAKRDGGLARVTLDEALAPAAGRDVDVLALHEALDRLAQRDPQGARIVELKFFGGLTNPEAAEVTGLSKATVEREWTLARAWLYREMTKTR